MTATSFIDTNILLYAASKAPEDQTKRQVARRLLTRPDIGFSAQVLQEFYAAAIAKQRLQMTHDESSDAPTGSASRLASRQPRRQGAP